MLSYELSFYCISFINRWKSWHLTKKQNCSCDRNQTIDPEVLVHGRRRTFIILTILLRITLCLSWRIKRRQTLRHQKYHFLSNLWFRVFSIYTWFSCQRNHHLLNFRRYCPPCKFPCVSLTAYFCYHLILCVFLQ